MREVSAAQVVAAGAMKPSTIWMSSRRASSGRCQMPSWWVMRLRHDQDLPLAALALMCQAPTWSPVSEGTVRVSRRHIIRLTVVNQAKPA